MSLIETKLYFYCRMKQSGKCLFILLAVFVSISAKAQLCQGSLGDPVVRITFGAGPNPGPQLSAATTNYIFNSTTCPNDGFYTVANSTTACFGDSWHTLSKDHTGDANGYFMLVNASILPQDFYVDTVRGLCPNTTFEFAAWIVNVLKTSACGGLGIDPFLTFSIETTTGTKLQSFETGNIPENAAPVWKQYGFFFKTPPDVTDVVVRIRNNAPGGCGNDLALDDITFRPCGPKVTASIGTSDTLSSKNICDDDTSSVTLRGNISSGYTDPAYQWQFSSNNMLWFDIAGATATTYTRKQTPIGTYYYRLTAAEKGNISSPKCRIVSNLVTIKVVGKPIPNAQNNGPVCEGTTLTLTANEGQTYAWAGPNNYVGSGSPSVIDNVGVSAAGRYFVKVTTVDGCAQNDSTDVVVIARPVANAGSDAGICQGSRVVLQGSGGGAYLWTPNTGLNADNIANPVASPSDSTLYKLLITDNSTGCTDSDFVAVNVYRLPTANAGPDKTMIQGDATTLNGAVTGTAVTLTWTPAIYISNANSLQPVVNPPSDTTYTLIVQSPFGCGVATDQVFVKVFKKVTIPNAFSPNNDGINDTWKIEAIEAYPDADIKVFNRYGQPVFATKSNTKLWDGTYNNLPLPVGTYYYVIDLKYGLPKLSGWVALLR